MVAGLYTFGANVNGLLLNNYAGTDLETWISMLRIRCCQPSDAASFDWQPLEMRLQHSERLESC